MFTYQNETAEGEGIINGAAMTIEKRRGGRIKFTSLTLKFADWFYFFKQAPANPLVRYADHISALQHRRVYLSRGGRRGQHHQVALLSQTPAGSATIVIHFISPLWRLQQICTT